MAMQFFGDLMEWLKDLNPFALGMLALAALSTAIILFAPKSAWKTEKPASESGLKKISLSQFGRYLNKTDCSCLQSTFDGSRFNFPAIGEVYSGRYESFIVTIFTLVLPTGRTGTRQTVIHLRPETPKWLPIFSIIDEFSGKKLSEILRCEHSEHNPLINPNYIARHDEADQLRRRLARSPLNQLSITALKSPLNGVVLDSTGEDLFFYRHGRIVEVNEVDVLKCFIGRSIELFKMIDTGKIDIGFFKQK